jgi:hypothetical protein
MNKNIFVTITALLATGVLIAPAMAIGPMDSNNNPNTIFPSPIQVQLTSPSGIFNEWIQNSPFGVPVHIQRKDAAEFNIGNAVDGTELTFPTDLVLYENKWIFLTQQEYYNLLISIGLPPSYVQVVVAPFTEGVYWRANYVG